MSTLEGLSLIEVGLAAWVVLFLTCLVYTPPKTQTTDRHFDPVL